MKVNLIFSSVLLVMVGVLFYLHFTSAKQKPAAVVANKIASSTSNAEFRIAYFDLDSLESQFGLLKEIKNELVQKDEENNRSKLKLRQTYQKRLNELQSQELTQVQSESAMRELEKLERDIRNQMQALDQQLQDLSIRRQTEAKNKIEDFLKDYNTTRGYSYIFAYEPGFMFYRDTMYNITADLIAGLNQLYPKKK